MGYVRDLTVELAPKLGDDILHPILYASSFPLPVILSEEVVTAERGTSARGGDASRLGVLERSWTVYSSIKAPSCIETIYVEPLLIL